MVDWLLALEGWYVYGGLIAMLLGGAIGLPIPEDIPLLLAGVLLHQGTAELGLAFISCYCGIMAGDLFLFYVGRKLGSSANKRGWFKAQLSPEKIEETRASIKKRGFLAILLARHLFYLRTVTFLACGAMRMDVKYFILCDGFAALLSSTLMISLGFMFSENYKAFLAHFKEFKVGLVIIGVIIALIFITRYLIKKYKNR